MITSARPVPILPLALLLTVLLTAWWTALAWTDLAALRLPHVDDMVRLAQIRDWLDGQSFGDLVQSRLGPPGGVAMSGSRLPDIVPGILIRVLTPVMGLTRAEIAAVIFWPEVLFLSHLLLAGAIARALGGPSTAAIAVALAALAAPAIGLFLPGRIDALGLQLVLVEAMMLGLLARHMVWAGLAAGVSLLVGVEALPVIVAVMIGLAMLWVRDRRPVAGLGIGLLAAALIGLVALRPDVWAASQCDGFTPPVFVLMLIAGGGWLVLAGLAPRLPDLKWRVSAAAIMGGCAIAATWLAAPACLPTAFASDSLWSLPGSDAAGLLDQTPGLLIGFLGLPLMGLATATLLAVKRPLEQGWVLLAFAMLAAILAAFGHLRAAAFAAALAAPVLAHLVMLAKGRGIAWQMVAWLVSVGLVWQAAGNLVEARAAPPASGCADRPTLSAIDRLDTGSFAAPMDLGPALLAATQHRSLGGLYSRNAAGNRALADLFRAVPEQARYQASLWTVDYIALCPSADGGLPPGLRRPGSLAAQLLAGDPPAWLDPVPLIGSDTLVWRVQPVATPGLRP